MGDIRTDVTLPLATSAESLPTDSAHGGDSAMSPTLIDPPTDSFALADSLALIPESGSASSAHGHSEYDIILKRQEILNKALDVGSVYYNRIEALDPNLLNNVEHGVLQYGVAITEVFGGLGTGGAAGLNMHFELQGL